MIGVGARLKFLRSALATRRWSLFKWFWLALGAYDLVLSQLVPKSLSDSFPKTYEALTTVSNHISWQAWAITGVAILVLASIEYSFRRVSIVEVVAASGVPANLSPPKGETKAETRSIAVMPFVNLSGDTDQEFIGDGLASDVIAALSRIRTFFVIARESTFQYKGKMPDVREIAKELGVRYIVEGNVRKQADRLRVSVQLVDGKTGRNLWTQRYDEKFEDIFDIQDELTHSIVAQLEPELSRAEYERIKGHRPESLDSWELYQRGQYFVMRLTKQDQESAQRFFEAAIKADANFAPAHAGLSYSIYVQALHRYSSNASYDQALLSAQRAIECDDRDPWSHLAMAAAWQGKRNFEAANRECETALNLNPSLVPALHHLATSYVHTGRSADAIPLLEKGISLSPRDNMVIMQCYSRLATAYLFLGQYDKAVEFGAKAVSLNGGWPSRAYLTASLAHAGRIVEARAAADALVAFQPEASIQFAERNTLNVHAPSMEIFLKGLRKAGLRETAEATLPDASLVSKTAQPSIAVLPFNNMSGDPEQEYFADGISEDIITALARVRQFMVIARNTTFTYKGKAVDVVGVAKELGVRYMLEGSVRKSGEKVRITAQLIDGSTGNHIWAERYDRDLADIFAVQDEITQMVVGAIGPELSRAEQERARMKHPTSLTAWDCYQHGTWHLWRLTPDDTEKAIAFFKKSVDLEPNFSSAHALLAFGHLSSFVRGYNGPKATDLADAANAARQAVILDNENAIAHWALGVLSAYNRDLTAAISQYNLCIKLDPSFAPGYSSLGLVLTFSGKSSEAFGYFDKADKIGPSDPLAWRSWFGRAWAHFFLSQYDEAISSVRRAILGSPSHLWNYVILLASYAQMNRLGEARETLHDIFNINKEFSIKFVEDHAPLDDVRRAKLIEALRKASVPEGNTANATVAAQASAVIKSSIAVLPFKNISGDPEQDVLGDGLAADVIAGLSRIRNFFVIAHSSTSQYRGVSIDVRQVAKDLNVRYVIEGNVRKIDDRLRLTVLLIDGETGHCLWTERYDEKFVDIMDVQDQLTKAVVGQLMPELDRAEFDRTQTQKPEGLDVWKLFHAGNSAYQRMTPNDLIEARRLYEEAITLEPNFAPAHARLSIALWNFAMITDGSDDIYNLGFASAQRAIALDDRDSLSHVAMARAYFGRRKFDEAIHQVRRAIKLNPSFAQANYDLGQYLMHSGHAEEAISFIETAIALSPRDPLIGVFYARMSQCNLYLERLDEAVEWGKKAQQESRAWPSFTPLISALGHLGRVEEARPLIGQFKQIRPEASINYVERQIPTVHRPYLDYYLKGLRKAGLPVD